MWWIKSRCELNALWLNHYTGFVVCPGRKVRNWCTTTLCLLCDEKIAQMTKQGLWPLQSYLVKMGQSAGQPSSHLRMKTLDRNVCNIHGWCMFLSLCVVWSLEGNWACRDLTRSDLLRVKYFWRQCWPLQQTTTWLRTLGIELSPQEPSLSLPTNQDTQGRCF